DGLTDIDLAFTPATNTLPIRRLGLKTGEAAATDAVWVRFPELTIERLPQRYAHIEDHTYRYESRGGSFTADLIVDGQGVVITYGDIWERVVP
ncbi:MAG TPA: putative glycolipid-binding domain-containing protein, partial [Longimicrobiales bacterium]|nr:putative glycolipid-binding domain-containing protein [Longimicrobiales bacterium]